MRTRIAWRCATTVDAAHRQVSIICCWAGGAVCRSVELNDNQLSGPLPLFKSLFAQKLAAMGVSRNILTGNASLYVEVFGQQPFVENCFNPPVVPVSRQCV
jgi:hypothetical protein